MIDPILRISVPSLTILLHFCVTFLKIMGYSIGRQRKSLRLMEVYYDV
jgi:hypothetical protein